MISKEKGIVVSYFPRAGLLETSLVHKANLNKKLYKLS